MIAESHWVHKYCRLRFSEDARSARTIMAHLERDRLKSWLWDMLWILYLQFSCTLYCQWHMHAHLSLFVSINNVRFLNTALLLGRSWDTRYFKFYLYFNATSICLQSLKGLTPGSWIWPQVVYTILQLQPLSQFTAVSSARK